MNGFTLGEILFLGLAPVLAMVIVTISFVWMRKADIKQAPIVATFLASVLGLWLSAVGILATSGWLSVWSGFPPRVPLLVVIAILSYLSISRASVVKLLISVMPLWLPVVVQSFRVIVELALWQMHREGSVPIQFTLEGRNLDMLVGLTAPIVALGIARKWIGPKSTMVWNMFGLALLVNAMFTAATSSPGPQHLDWPGEPFIAIATWPLVWLPSFLAPTAVFLHVISMTQCMAANGRSRSMSE